MNQTDPFEKLTLFRTMLMHAKEKAAKDRRFEEAEEILDQARDLLEDIRPHVTPELAEEMKHEYIDATLYVEHARGDFPPDPEQEP